MFKKFEASVLDICTLYACMGFITYVVGTIAYNIGKDRGREEQGEYEEAYEYYDARRRGSY